jgi:hypothetical protein
MPKHFPISFWDDWRKLTPLPCHLATREPLDWILIKFYIGGTCSDLVQILYWLSLYHPLLLLYAVSKTESDLNIHSLKTLMQWPSEPDGIVALFFRLLICQSYCGRKVGLCKSRRPLTLKVGIEVQRKCSWVYKKYLRLV